MQRILLAYRAGESARRLRRFQKDPDRSRAAAYRSPVAYLAEEAVRRPMDLASALSLVSTIAIVIGVIFAAYQIYVLRLQRAREVQMTVARSLQTPDFQEALQTIVSLPEGLSKADIDARLGPKRIQVFHWFGTMEILGVLVHHREVPLSVVDDFFSGPIVLSWRRLEGYVADVRRETGRETMHEWFQWLAERFVEREQSTAPVPAHIAYRDWEP